MSLSVKRAKFQGDPGLFGFLGGAIKKVAGVVGGLGIPGVSAGARLASKGLGAVLGAKVRMPIVSGGGQGFRVPQGQPGRFLPGPGGSGGGSGTAVATRPQGQPRGSSQAVVFVGPRGECPAGFRPNKSGYWVTSSMGTPSFVSPGERCVRRRRRNPTNIRALDRAMSRVISANRLREKLKGWPTAKRC